MRTHVALAAAIIVAALVVIGVTTGADAAEKCTAKINSKTGALEIQAKNVIGSPRWGAAIGATTETFPNEVGCFVGGALKKCALGGPGTLAAMTPPANCTVCVGDAGPNACCALLKGCTPGIRPADASLPPGDPRLSGSVLDPALVALVTHMEIVGNTIRFTGANVQIVDGSGSTYGATNGLGNLIIGYNADNGDVRTGSHNLVVGDDHTYSSFGGIIGGFNNATTGPGASILGGEDSVASGNHATVSGGRGNTASGEVSSVTGGGFNSATATESSVSGGLESTSYGIASSVSGGWANQAAGNYSSASGGQFNSAEAPGSSVSGGSGNVAGGTASSVSGGEGNTTSAAYTSISGGKDNRAGGSDTGVGASVSGGHNRSATGEYDWAAGDLFKDF